MSNLYLDMGQRVAFLLEKCRKVHPRNGSLCVHGLPLTVIAAEAPEPFRPPLRFRVHCSQCVVDAVLEVIKGS